MRLAQPSIRHRQNGRHMDPLQRATDAGDLHEWETSLP